MMNFIETHPWVTTGIILLIYFLGAFAFSKYKTLKRKWGENR